MAYQQLQQVSWCHLKTNIQETTDQHEYLLLQPPPKSRSLITDAWLLPDYVGPPRVTLYMDGEIRE